MSNETFLAKTLFLDSGFGERSFSDIFATIKLSIGFFKKSVLNIFELNFGISSFFGGI